MESTPIWGLRGRRFGSPPAVSAEFPTRADFPLMYKLVRFRPKIAPGRKETTDETSQRVFHFGRDGEWVLHRLLFCSRRRTRASGSTLERLPCVKEPPKKEQRQAGLLPHLPRHPKLRCTRRTNRGQKRCPSRRQTGRLGNNKPRRESPYVWSQGGYALGAYYLDISSNAHVGSCSTNDDVYLFVATERHVRVTPRTP